MHKNIGVLAIHGVGILSRDYWCPMADACLRALATAEYKTANVAFESVFWADLCNCDVRSSYIAELIATERSGDGTAFLTAALGDAVVYRRMEAGGWNRYLDVHERVLQGLQRLHSALGEECLPLVVVAHSMGSVVISDFIWNAQQNNGWCMGKNGFERAHSLAGVLTLGSMLPVTSFAMPTVEAIVFPPRSLDERLRNVAEWHNYYYREDALAGPLRGLAEGCARAVTADHELRMSPEQRRNWEAAHTSYWQDPVVAAALAAQIVRLAATRKPPM